MSIVKNMINDVYSKLIKDEYLLRLLYCEPSSPKLEFPLKPEDNIIVDFDTSNGVEPPLEYDKMWDIIDEHIMLSSKSDDLEVNRLCRIYLYAGKSRPSVNNKYVTRQEIVADIFCHYTYGVDQRLESIIGRLDDLLMWEQITGLGKVDQRGGYNFTAPKEYIAYRMIYEVGRSK